MTVKEYIKGRIEAIKLADTTEHDGLWREETYGQRQSRINELNNLLDVIAAHAGYGRWLRA